MLGNVLYNVRCTCPEKVNSKQNYYNANEMFAGSKMLSPTLIIVSVHGTEFSLLYD